MSKVSTEDGRFVLLSGEAGVGKTRLAFEFLSRAEKLGFRCLHSRCSSDSKSPLYSPWIQFINHFSQHAPAQLFFKVCGSNLNQIIKLVPELSESINGSVETPHTKETDDSNFASNPQDTQLKEMQFLLALTQLFSKLAEDSPLLLILDDIQWCDPASLNVINLLIANNLNARIFLICVYRDTDLREKTNPAVSMFLESAYTHPKFRKIHLSRLTQEYTTELVDKLFGPDQHPSFKDFRRTLYNRSGGNPLFVSEVLRSLIERKSIFKNKDGNWAIAEEVNDSKLPETVRSVIEQRLEQLDQAALVSLRIASVIGEQFGLETLTRVMKQHPLGISRLEDSLNWCVRSGLLIKTDFVLESPGYSFSDEFVREVLYSQLSDIEKQNYHLTIANVLEQQLAQKENLNKTRMGELAYHFLKGGSLAKAQEYFIQAGKRASELYAHSNSYDYYNSALRLSETSSANTKESKLLRADLLKRMGDESQFLTEYERTFDCWTKSAYLYESCDEKLKAADVYVKLGMAYHLIMYELDKSDKSLEKAVSLANESGTASSAELARITAYSLTSDIWRSDRKKVMEKAALAGKLAAESGAYDVLAMICSYDIGTDSVGEIEASIASCNRGIKISQEHNLMWEASYNYFHRASAHCYTYGPSQKSLDLYLDGLNFTASRGNFMVNLFHKVELACAVYLPLGEWTKARQLAEESLESVRRFSRSSLFCLIAESAMGQILLHQGELEKAEEYLEHVREVTRGFGILQLDVPLYIALSRLNIEKSDFDKAEQYLKEGERLSRQRGLTVVNGVPHIQLLAQAIEFHLIAPTKCSEDLLDSILADLEESSKAINKPWTLGYLYRSEALVAQHRRENEKAFSLFEKSVEVFQNLGWPYELARTEYMFGMANIKRGKVMAAMNLFDSAHDVFFKLGAKSGLERISAIREGIEEQGLLVIDERPKFESKEARIAFENLVTEFLQDFMIDKFETERCGWRSLSELKEMAKLSKYSLYGNNRYSVGPVLKELLSSSAVESRTFAGERGRGGEVMKIRMSPQKTALGRYGESKKQIPI
ncbi:MAG: AAA family ATPase [Nitrososphaerota archaeon]|nr:AAA family ATPase [Nitrososphaerota archaeon]MDG6923384.1 AAA family ATPase [Nitrososphaerota archaeon]